MNRTRIRLKAALLQLPYQLRDRRQNRRWVKPQPRFLILRHPGKYPYFRDSLLTWLSAALPEVRALFELRLLPLRNPDWSAYRVCAPWLQDPAEDWLPRTAWTRLRQIQDECDRRNIPVLNRVENLSRTVKSTGAQCYAAAGARTPRVVVIRDPAAFTRDPGEIRFPIIIREDRRHAADTCVIHEPGELRNVPWNRFQRPVAAEFIDVRDARDGLYRKYRYIVAGAFAVPRHLIVSSSWEVRAAQRLRNRQTREEEIAYLEHPEPNHMLFQRIQQALRLDLVAFDYSYDAQGQLVIWEANTYPGLGYAKGPDVEYTRAYVERSFAAVTAMHLDAGGLELPDRIVQMLASCRPSTARVRPGQSGSERSGKRISAA